MDWIDNTERHPENRTIGGYEVNTSNVVVLEAKDFHCQHGTMFCVGRYDVKRNDWDVACERYPQLRVLSDSYVLRWCELTPLPEPPMEEISYGRMD